MADEATTFTMELAGRQVGFKRPTLGQVIMLQRMATRSRAAAENSQSDDRVDHMTNIMVKTLDFIETLILEPEDREFVEEQMIAGTIDYTDLLAALSGGKRDEETADDQAPRPRRAASKKVAKPVAKTVASRGRTQR